MRVPGGSSPRRWGKQLTAHRRRGRLRIIPTQVGKTRGFAVEARGTADHPHAGGENKRRVHGKGASHGSSPRRWGKHLRSGERGASPRIIPTQVGKTSILCDGSVGSEDHPHAGGENCQRQTQSAARIGSSPRRWGKLAATPSQVRLHRIIPTQVGKTWTGWDRQHLKWDHPHAGGENLETPSLRNLFPGSSPRRWGKLIFEHRLQQHPRIIPTQVGKTPRRPWDPPPSPDHPHAGGENEVRDRKIEGVLGSSPRRWGKLDGGDGLGFLIRIIPTQVGKTVCRYSSWSSISDHPHAGGENNLGQRYTGVNYGSSPRRWGKLGVRRRGLIG